MEAVVTGGLSSTVIRMSRAASQDGQSQTITSASAIVASDVGPHVVRHPGQANGQ